MSSPRERALEETVKRLEQENKLLREKLDLLIRRLHGKSSEKTPPQQQDFLAEEEKSPGKPKGDGAAESKKEETVAKPKPRAKRSKPRLPEHLPVESCEELIPQEVLDHPDEWRRIGEEVSEQLDFRPGRFFRRQLVRPKYVHMERRDEPPIIAPLPNRWTERCLASTGLQAHIAISKYADHIPLYRQEQIFRARYGVDLPRNTMARWMDFVAESLKMIYTSMLNGLRAADYLQIDETPIKYLDPGGGKTAQGYFWAFSSPQGDVIFDWQTSRGHECLLQILAPTDSKGNRDKTRPWFQGIVQCDGHGAYKVLAKKVDGIVLGGCWAHVRRKFHDALGSGHSAQAEWILRQIGLLYAIEKRLRETKTGPRHAPRRCQSVRASESLPIVARIKKALMRFKARPSILPQSLLGRATDYALTQWETLEVFLRDGRVAIDNNGVENAIRPTALGKKNWLFVGSADTGDRSAILYSIIESCRRRGIEPYAYLSDVLARVPNATNQDVYSLTPEGWAKDRAGGLPSE